MRPCVSFVLAGLALSSLAGCAIDDEGAALADAQAVLDVSRSTDGGSSDVFVGKSDARGGHDSSSSEGSSHQDARPPLDVRSQDVAQPSDVVTEAPPPTCPATPDCSNQACKNEGYTCVPAPPASWTLAAVEFGGGSCPAGYGQPMAEVTASGQTPVCMCSPCSVTHTPSCTTDGMISTHYGDTQCNSSPTYTTGGNGGACMTTTNPQPVAPMVEMVGFPTASAGASCGSSLMMNIPPVETSNVLVCPVAVVPSSTGCASNEVCAVAAASPARTCIYQAGATSCPGTYPTSTSVGTAPTDTRMCTGSCECSAAASCTPTSWTFFQKGGCDASGGSVSINVDGNCHSTGAVGGSSYGSYSYEATTQVACSASGGSAMASGSVGVTGESTVCCM